MAGTHGNRATKNNAVLAQAEEWFVRARAGDMTVAEEAAWQRWLEENESHKRAFQDVENFWKRLGRTRDLSWLPTAEELNADRYEGQMPLAVWINAQDVHPTRDRANAREGLDQNPRRRLWFWPGVAAAAVMAAVLLLNREFFDSATPPQQLSVTTEVGQHRELTLPDGSIVTVGARSGISVQFNDRTRSIRLESGEAYFTVAHEDARPFVVHAGDGTITAVGTAFNVQQIAGRVVVTVMEGSVQVTSIPATLMAEEISAASTPPRTAAFPATRLKAGQQLEYGEVFTPARAVNPAMAAAWRAGDLEYLGQPLKFVIPDVQRYSHKRLVIADEQVGELGFSGTVFKDDVEGWLGGLEQSMPIEVVAVDDHTLLLEARPR